VANTLRKNYIAVLITNWDENHGRVLELERKLVESGFIPVGTWSTPKGSVYYRVEALSKDKKEIDVRPVFTDLGFTLSGGGKDEV
jgi:hypothetical protein